MRVRAKANYFDGRLHEKGEEFEYSLAKGAKLPSCLEAVSEVDKTKTNPAPAGKQVTGDLEVI